MQDFNEFDQKINEDRSKNDTKCDPCTAQSGEQQEPSGDTVFEYIKEPTTPYPQWYGVSYNGDDAHISPLYQIEEKKKRRTKKIAIVAALLAACILLMTLAGFGGYRLAVYLKNNAPSPSDPPFVNTGTPSGIDPSTVYGVGDAAQYDFAGAVIEKNDGTTLVDSTTGSVGSNAMSRIAAVAMVKDSVVEITTTAVSSYGQLTAGAGSGVIIHGDGIIVTNHHVIDGATTIYVRLTNGNTYEAYLRGTDEQNDIAVLKITPQETLTVAKLGCSSALALGEDVFAIGNPLGQLGGTVTSGIISALEREVNVNDETMTLLQTNAAINSGNSGGGLFNHAGELIGVVNAKYSASGVEGLGFAIPVDTAIVSINSLLDYGYIKGIADLGVTLSQKTVRINNGYYSQYVYMPYVYAAPVGSPLQAGDLIYKVGDTVLSTTDGTSFSLLKRIVRTYSVGQTVTLTIYRGGQQMTVSVTLTEYVPS